jgi:hypothetical protein
VHTRQSWAAPVALMISAALLAGCTGDSPEEEPTTAAAAPPTEAPPSPEPSPSEEPSEEPSLSPADEAAAQAEAAYRDYFEFQNEVLQAPPEITGDGPDVDAATDELVRDIRQHAFGDMEGLLISVLRRYDSQNWRQVGASTIEDLDVEEVVLEPPTEDARPWVLLSVCLASDGVDVVGEDGQRPEELSNVDIGRSAATIRLEYLKEAEFDGWYVESTANSDRDDC